MGREKVILYTAPFSMSVVLGMITLSVPLFVIKLGASAFTLGGLGFTGTLFYVILTPLFGKLVDRIGYRYLLCLGVSAYFLSSLALSMSTRIYQFFIFMPFMGAAGAIFWPSFEVWMTEAGKNEPLLKRISFFNISWCLGTGTGPLIAGVLFEVHPRFPFYFASFLSLVITFVILKELFQNKEKHILSTGKNLLGKSSPSNSKEIFSYYLYIGWIANFANYFCIGIIRYLFPKLSVQIGIAPFFIGILLFTISLFQTFTFYILGKTSTWHYKLMPLVFLQLLGICGLLLVFFGNSPIFFLFAFMFIGIGAGMAYFSSIFYSLSDVKGKGQKSGIHEAVLGSGSLFGPLIGGATAEVYTLRFPYLLAAFVIAAALFIEILLIGRKTR